MVKVLLAAMWAGCLLLLLEPVIKAGLTEVLSTAASKVRITKNFGTDTAVKLFKYWLGEVEVVPAIPSLVSGTCYSHSTIFSVVL